MGIMYPVACGLTIKEFFTDLDGTTVRSGMVRTPASLSVLHCPWTATFLRCCLGVQAIGLRAAIASMESEFSYQPTWVDRWCNLPTHVLAPFLYLDRRLQKVFHCCSVNASQRKVIRRNLGWLLNVALVLALGLLFVCIYFAIDHFGPWKPSLMRDPDCDPLDETECWVSFPSFHALRPENSSATGWRVNLEGRLLPSLKSRVSIQPNFLNLLDGFSTMAPMMFYLEGLKEAHVAGASQLKGLNDIAESITGKCSTLLLDVKDMSLVPHSAEVDFLDGQHPLVLLCPAEPLHHNRHYAVAVVDAKDAQGTRLPQTRGMSELLGSPSNYTSKYNPDRRQRYIDVLIPALEKAASWFDYSNDPDALQLLFDFHTVSAESQLGPVRSVRDAMLEQISSDDWQWEEHVRTIRTVDHDCSLDGATLARTVHAELDVPWFMDHHGPGGRYSFLDECAIAMGRSTGLRTSKFLILILCSLQVLALSQCSTLTKPNRCEPLWNLGTVCTVRKHLISDTTLYQTLHPHRLPPPDTQTPVPGYQ